MGVGVVVRWGEEDEESGEGGGESREGGGGEVGNMILEWYYSNTIESITIRIILEWY